MAEESSGGGGRRRRSRRRGRSGNSSGNVAGNTKDGRKRAGGRSRRPRKANGNQRRSKSPKHESSKPHSEPAAGATRYFTGELNEFELFCAYYLHLDERGCYRKMGMNDIARRFNEDASSIQSALATYKIDVDTVRKSAFDPELARLDIKVAPPGIDRVEIARTLFQELLDTGCGVGPIPSVKAAEAPPSEE